MDIWMRIYGYAYGYIDIWIYGYMDIWILGYLDICICVYIYICMHESYQPFAAVSQLPVALRRFLKMTPLDLLNTYLINLVDFHGFEGPWICFQKVGNQVK